VNAFLGVKGSPVQIRQLSGLGEGWSGGRTYQPALVVSVRAVANGALSLLALGDTDLGFALQAPDLVFCLARKPPAPPFLLVLKTLQLVSVPGRYALKGAGLALLADTCRGHGPDGGDDQRLIETGTAHDIRRYPRPDQDHDHPVVQAGG
jgi:hypothetical protein